MKRLLFSILGMCLVLSASAQDIRINDIIYKRLSSKEVEVSDLYLFFDDSIIIPSEITFDGCNYKVTSIGEGALRNFQAKSIKLPNTLKTIKKSAFNFCYGLESITIPNSVISIGDSAFYWCPKLESITIPNSVISIGESAFEKCDDLESITIPNSVISIGEKAFRGCHRLKSITIPNSVISIGEQAFWGCHRLKSITIPNSVRKLNQHWLSCCASLQHITWPDHLIIPKDYFFHCGSLKSIKGHKTPHLSWLKSDMLDSNSPLYKELHYLENYRYSNWAYDRIVNAIEKWQKKGEFETTEQWKQRVTEENRKLELANVESQLRNEFIIKNQPKKFYTFIDKYDADNNVFTIKVQGLKPFYLEVPLNEAEEVKEKWHKAKLKPSYGIVENEVGVVSCICKIGKKIYRSVQYNPDDYIEEFALNLPPLQIDLGNDNGGGQSKKKTVHPVTIDNTIDKEVPVNPIRNQKTFALIIGNENYQNTAKVTYAHNDANSFAAYCHKTLGIPEKNIRSYKDATLGVMMTALKDIKSIAKAYKGDIQVIFYYAGHGIPGSRGEKAYLLPVDMDGSQPELCLSTEHLYKELSSLNVRSTIVFMDACFSGSQRGEGMLANARAVALKVKQVIPQGNCVVFSAASNEQTAFPYMEKGHGMFTYFLLKKLQESKGNVTLGELGEYIYENVVRQSVVVNRKEQTPTIVSSTLFEDKWKSIKLK